MDLLVIRHADAEARSGRMADAERALTEKGHQQAERAGRFLARHGPAPSILFTSPFRRALQTAEGVEALLQTGALLEERILACGMEPEAACDLLAYEAAEEKCVALIGHEPDLSMLLTFLLGMQTAGCIKMKKASIAHLLLDRPGYGGGQLRTLLPSACQG